MVSFFIDRPETDKFLKELAHALANPQDRPVVFHAWGIGGVGKTTLLKKVRESHPEAAIAEVSFGLTSLADTPLQVMEQLHRQIWQRGDDWEHDDEFNSLLDRYKTTLSKLEKDKDFKELAKVAQSAAQGLLVTEKLAAETVKQGLQMAIESTGMTERLNAFLNQHPATKKNVELQNLIREPLPILTRALVKSWRSKAQKQPIIILLDTYEKVLPDIDRWLWHTLLANHDLQDVRVRLVVTGRDRLLQKEGWRKLQQDRQLIYEDGVDKFNEAQTVAYLHNIGIVDRSQQAQIYRLTKGLPYLLNAVRYRYERGELLLTLDDRLNDDIVSLLLQEPDTAQRQKALEVVQVAACCRWFDRGLLKYLLEKLGWEASEIGVWYDWLKRQHFVQSDPLRLDDVARDVFHQSLRREDGDSFVRVHEYLAEYFQAKSDSYAPPDSSYPHRYENRDWLDARTEYLYHRLFARQLDKVEFLSHLLEARYFNADGLVQFPLLWVGAEGFDSLLSEMSSKFLRQIYPAVFFGWAVLEKVPIDYDFNERAFGLSKAVTDAAIRACLEDYDRFTGLARFMALYCKLLRCQSAETERYLQLATAEAGNIVNTHSIELKFCSGLFLWKLGAGLFNLDRYEEAIAAFDRALEIRPDNHEALNNKGSTLDDLGRYEEAIAAFDRALEIRPDNHEYLYNKGTVLGKLGRHEEAITAFARALAIKPEDHEALYNKGIALDRLGRYEEAIAEYDRALAIKPDKHEALHNKGSALDRLGRYEEAIAEYDRALAIKPDKHEALHNKGSALDRLGRYEEAIAEYDRALAIEPDKHEALYNKGVVFIKLGRYEEAIAEYDRALAIKPDKHEALHNKGSALFDLGRHEEAIAEYDRVLAIKPDDHEALYSKGVVFIELGRYEDAIAEYDRALAIKPDKHKASNNKGGALFVLGRYEEAIAEYDRALAIKADYYSASFNKGNALYELGRYEEAIAALDCAININPNDANAHYLKSCLLGKLVEIEPSIASLRMAIDLDPKYREMAKTDNDFDSIRDRAEFQELLAEMN